MKNKKHKPKEIQVKTLTELPILSKSSSKLPSPSSERWK